MSSGRHPEKPQPPTRPYGPTSPASGEVQLAVRCECGFEVRGSADEIVPALQKHAGESHNMKVTREQVLARAHPI
jgi:predicted small metal-binding protein